MVPPARMGGISRALTPRVNYSRRRDRMQSRFSNARSPFPCPCCLRGLAPCSPAACLAAPVPGLAGEEPARGVPALHAAAEPVEAALAAAPGAVLAALEAPELAALCVRAGSAALPRTAASPAEVGAVPAAFARVAAAAVVGAVPAAFARVAAAAVVPVAAPFPAKGVAASLGSGAVVAAAPAAAAAIALVVVPSPARGAAASHA